MTALQRRTALGTTARPRARRGVALLEAIIAMSILVGSVLVAGGYFTRLSRGVSDERTRATALFLIGERFELIRTAPTYGSIDSLYAGVENNIPGYAGYFRATEVSRVGGHPADSIDYKIISVTVKTPAVFKSLFVTKSIVVADF